MRRKWKIITTLGILTVTCGLYTWGIPALVNIKSHKSQIETLIKKNTNINVDIGNPKLSMGLFPSVWVESDNISIIDKNNKKALSIDNPRLNLRLLPLLRKQINIKKLSATKEEIHLIYTKDGLFKIGNYPIKIKKNQKKQFELAKINLDLGEYSIDVDDQKFNKKINYSGKHFTHGEYVKNKKVKFSTDSTLTIDNSKTPIITDVDISLPLNSISEDQLKISANIDKLDLSTLSNYIKILSKGLINSSDGIITLKADTNKNKFGHKKINININSKDLSIVGKDKIASIIYPEDITATFNISTVENGININNSTFDTDNIHLNVNGAIFNLGKDKPSYNVTAEVKDTKLEDVVAILPWMEKRPKEFNFYKLKQYKFYGKGEGKVKFEGHGTRPNVTGYVKLRDTYLIHPITGADGNANIDLKFVGQKMLLDVDVPTTNKQKVTVNGYAMIDGSKYSVLDIKSTKAVQLAPAQEILVPLHEILNFQIGPVPMMKIAGIGNIDVHSAGKKVDPHLWGDINFYNGTASFNDIHNLVLYNGNGNVHFNDTKVTFKTTSATINNKPAEISGDCIVLGKLNVYINSKGQDIKALLKTIQTSPILVDVQKVVKPFNNPEGLADIFLHIYGKVDKHAEEIVFNEDIFSKGTITLHNAKTIMQDTFLPFTNINGVVNFDKYDSNYDVTGLVRNSKLHVYGTGTNSEIDLKADTNKFQLADIFDLLHPDQLLPFKEDLGKIFVSFKGGYKGYADVDNIDYNKIKVNGNFLPNMSSSNNIKLDGGNFTIDNGYLKTSTLKGLFNNNPYTLSFTSKDIDKEDINISEANYNFKNFDINSINSIKKQIKLPKDIEKQLNEISDITGNIDISGSIKNNNINAKTDLKGVTFNYNPLKAHVRILNGTANMVGNALYLDKINSYVSGMPVFLNGKISDALSNNPKVNLSLSAKPTQQFFDRVFNSQSVYPIKSKGNINLISKITGDFSALNLKSKLNIGENASLYYMGATIAGVPTGTLNTEEVTTNPVSIISDVILYPQNKLKIKSLNYNQLITSQNKKLSTQNLLNASGDISLLDNNVIAFKDFKIKTENPTNAKIFNIAFKKPTIKQGVFTTDLTINGTSSEPSILGYLNINSIDMPLLDATVRDINIDFQKDIVNLTTKAMVFTNDILMTAQIINKPTLPIVVEDINIAMEELNLNVIAKAVDDYEADNTRLSINQPNQSSIPVLPANTLIIKNAEITADNVLIKKATANKFNSHLTLDKDMALNIDKFGFNIANGEVSGAIDYDLSNLKGTASMNIENADASIIAENFFDMPGQVYGLVTGGMSMSCNGLTSIDCINTLNGEGSFNVKDGRMPKLGSLEYLLKAGNLITGGITGVSINGIIDLITPLKTGNFKSISGDIHVKDGVADEINVYSNGDDLNMYMTGSYNLATLVADMEVYGSLSKNFSTLTGKIANTSLNTLFNTIPGININEINPKSTSNIHKIPNFDKNNTLRVFKADIFGDINGSNYVKSFRWIKE